jgi:hypothetical protein
MKFKSFTVFFLFILTANLNGQEKKEEPKFGTEFSGYVKTDLYYDSRQIVNLREDFFLLYPENQKLDLNGKDIYAKDHSGILSIQSRLTWKVTGPVVLKAKPSAMIEADFFGNENANFVDINGFRLRHAIIKLNWPTTEFLVGQYWHPLFVPECFPDVASFNTGAPFQPFSRSPQIRLSQTLQNLKLTFIVAEQRDFLSTGPDGANHKYLSNGLIPDLNLNLQYSHLWNEKNEFLIGTGIEYKQLVPRLYSQTDVNLKDGSDSIYYTGGDKVKSSAISVYAKLRLKPVTIKAYAIYGSNMFDHVMLGGYAVSSITTGNQLSYDYAPVRNMSFWTELSTNGKTQVGIFAGYTRNLGTKINNTGIYYSRGSNINYVYRISPRIVFNMAKLRISTELEYTSAQYGKADSKGIVNSNLTTVSNFRVLTAFYYFF